MDEVFEQNYYTRTAKRIFRTGHITKRLMKWMAFYDTKL